MTEACVLAKWLLYVKNVSLKKAAYFLAVPILYIFLPVYISRAAIRHPFIALLLFYGTNILLAVLMARWAIAKGSQIRFKNEDLESTVNMQSAQNDAERRNNISLKEKIRRY